MSCSFALTCSTECYGYIQHRDVVCSPRAILRRNPSLAALARIFYPLKLTREPQQVSASDLFQIYTGSKGDGKQCVLIQRIASEVDNYFV